MEHYLTKISSLLVEPVSGTPSLCKIFVAKPSIEKELAVGKLFGFAEITPPQPGAAQLINNLLEQVKNDLYQPGETPAAPDPATPKDFSEHFGAVLQRGNSAIAEFLESSHVRINLEQCSLLMASLRQQEITLATVGNVTGYLFHYRASRDYHAVTITEPNPTAEINPLRLFAQNITGSIGPLDFIFFCTEGILDYLSLHTIKTLVTGNAGPEAMRQLKLAIAKANPRATAAAVVANLVLQRPAAPPSINLKTFDYVGAAARDSMRTLHLSQQRTSRLLSPRLMPDGRKLQRILSQLTGGIAHLLQRLTGGSSASKNQAAKAGAPTAPRREARSRPTTRVWSHALQGIAAGARRLTRKIFDNPVLRAGGNLLHRGWQTFRGLPPRRRLAIAGSIVLGALLLYNLVSLSSRKIIADREKAFANVLAQVERLRDAAQEALIFQDEGIARQRLNDGLRELDQLPESYRDHPTVVRSQRELTKKLIELRHEIVLAEPLQLANFNNLSEPATVAPLLVKLGDRLYAQNVKTNELLLLNLATRAIATVQPSASLPAPLVSSTSVGNASILLDRERRIFRLTAGERISPMAVNLPSGSLAAIGSYRDRIYLLETTTGIILRADATAGGFGAPRNWITDPAIDLRSAVDIALEGDLYTLLGDGQILKLRQGRSEPFPLQPVDPPLSGPTKIKTAEGNQFLYVLDPPTKRLVVIDKTGRLVAQYRSAVFDELRDLVVDEAKKTIYLLNGPRIFGVPMEHLR